MFKVKVNNQAERTIEFYSDASGTINNEAFLLDMITIKPNSFHIIKDNKSYSVEVVKADYTEKNFIIKINGNKYNVSAKDKFDVLLKSLGLDSMNVKKVNDIKAPMPGLVLDIKVNEGDEVKKGDTILVLEAMKMENNIKSPADGVVKKIGVKKGQAVEKNQVLINF
jgi:biotin carboxyl carrier protein